MQKLQVCIFCLFVGHILKNTWILFVEINYSQKIEFQYKANFTTVTIFSIIINKKIE